MRTKKCLAGLLIAILLVTSLPARAIPPNLATRIASGYYPSVQTLAKYYECYLGGTRTYALAQLTYGSEVFLLSINASANYYSPAMDRSGIVTGLVNGYGSIEVYMNLPGDALLAGGHISNAQGTYHIQTTQIAYLYTA